NKYSLKFGMTHGCSPIDALSEGAPEEGNRPFTSGRLPVKISGLAAGSTAENQPLRYFPDIG
ncbi:hypothetical protein, partial [Cesiribacter andamanensis]|uniref:hypothetical protein n=1 Tax=Cesiribacter andamanensis TaxID=649507 RepID=UPI001F1A6C56